MMLSLEEFNKSIQKCFSMLLFLIILLKKTFFLGNKKNKGIL